MTLGHPTNRRARPVVRLFGAAVVGVARASGAARARSPGNISPLVLAPAQDRRLHRAACRFSI
jgi:hypothetical protein